MRKTSSMMVMSMAIMPSIIREPESPRLRRRSSRKIRPLPAGFPPPEALVAQHNLVMPNPSPSQRATAH